MSSWLKIKVCTACSGRYLFPHFHGLLPCRGLLCLRFPRQAGSHSGKALIRNFCHVHDNRQGRVSPNMKVQACGSSGNLAGTSDRLQRLGKVYGRRESEPICGRRISESCRKRCSLKTGGWNVLPLFFMGLVGHYRASFCLHWQPKHQKWPPRPTGAPPIPDLPHPKPGVFRPGGSVLASG